MIDLTSSDFYDRVFGCWMGKNCGGTLGAPLEKSYGEEEPFDVWWYPKLQEGGIPNDDLEMQLVWLKALEEVGPKITARELTEYWLNHIGYNWDEYGWARMNFRMGLLPPMGGRFNNYFVDCMGCPIRSEIFACIAPGLPRLAVRYAYEDAITDHAGGESVYGEMFNCAIESAAFLISDLNELLDIGRSYVAEGSATARAIDAARKAHAAGLDWKAARRKVLEATPHYNSQYSPINMGFQTVGLLYGKDFAETLCIAVNCGYDTDCTGATVGSILGIIHGNAKLPEKWTQPLGDTIATNESWGGLRAVSTGPNPIPADLHDLTLRTIAQAIRFSAGQTPSKDSLYADESIFELWRKPTTRVTIPTGTFSVDVEYHDSPAIIPGTTKTITTILKSSAPRALETTLTLANMTKQVEVPAYGELAVQWSIDVPDRVENVNHAMLQIVSRERTAQAGVPIVLIGSRRMLIGGPYIGDFDQAFEPENLRGDVLANDARGGSWNIHHTDANDLQLAPLLPAGAAMYVRMFLHSEAERPIILGVPTSGAVKSWVNGTLLHNLPSVERFRPHLHKTQAYLDVTLKAGFNEILLKLVRFAGTETFDAHVALGDPNDRNGGIIDCGWTRLAWE